MNLVRHFNDCTGKKFDVGDIVGVAFETGHRGRIRIGTVLSLDSKADEVVVSWHDGDKKVSKPLQYRKDRFVLLRRSK